MNNPFAGTKFYELLGVEKDASSSQIKKAYVKLARKYHPDKNPNAGDKFKEITTAYDILSDDTKRQVYDRFGELGINEGMHNQPNQQEDMGFSSTHAELEKTASVTHKLRLPLEDLYNGKNMKVKMRRTRICTSCNGKTPTNSKKCISCNGSGATHISKQIKQSLLQNVSVKCKDCLGSGTVVAIKDRCVSCKGMRTTKETHCFDVYIDRGMQPENSIVFTGEGNQEPGFAQGDVIFLLEHEDHPIYRLEGLDLHTNIEISLVEAVTEFSFVITQLDGRELLIVSNPNETVRPGDVRVIKKEGFPRYRNPLESGDLYIHFTILFPNQPLLQHKEILTELLPGIVRDIPHDHDYQTVHLDKGEQSKRTTKQTQDCVHQ